MARKKVGGDAEEVQAQAHDEVASGIVETASDLDVEMTALEQDVQRAYEESVTVEEAERLAAKVLTVQLKIARELAITDLNARMRKNGLKAQRAQAYMDECNKSEKKPAEGYLENVVTLDPKVKLAQATYDEQDARKESLTLYLGIFKDAHIYFRGIARGNYNG